MTTTYYTAPMVRRLCDYLEVPMPTLPIAGAPDVFVSVSTPRATAFNVTHLRIGKTDKRNALEAPLYTIAFVGSTSDSDNAVTVDIQVNNAGWHVVIVRDIHGRERNAITRSRESAHAIGQQLSSELRAVAFVVLAGVKAGAR